MLSVAREALAAIRSSGSVRLGWSEVAKVAVLTLQNPGKSNSISPAMACQLLEHVETLRENSLPSTPRAVVIQGDGSQFCAGADVTCFGEPGIGPHAPQSWEEAKERGEYMNIVMTEALDGLKGLEIPSISLIEGAAVGGGAEVAVSTDLRCFAPGSSLGFIHRHMGVTPGWGGARRLRKIVGSSRASSLLLTARRLGPIEASRFGLCDLELEYRIYDDKLPAGELGPVGRQAVNRLFGEQGRDHLIALKRVAQTKTTPEEEKDTFLSLWCGPGHRAALEQRRKK